MAGHRQHRRRHRHEGIGRVRRAWPPTVEGIVEGKAAASKGMAVEGIVEGKAAASSRASEEFEGHERRAGIGSEQTRGQSSCFVSRQK